MLAKFDVEKIAIWVFWLHRWAQAATRFEPSRPRGLRFGPTSPGKLGRNFPVLCLLLSEKLALLLRQLRGGNGVRGEGAGRGAVRRRRPPAVWQLRSRRLLLPRPPGNTYPFLFLAF